MVFPKDFFEKVDFEKNIADDKENMENSPGGQNVKWMRSYLVGLDTLVWPLFVSANSDGSNETAWMHGLQGTFSARTCDKM